MDLWTVFSEALKRKGFSASEIRELKEHFGGRGTAALRNMPSDRLLKIIPGRTQREKQAKMKRMRTAFDALQTQTGKASAFSVREKSELSRFFPADVAAGLNAAGAEDLSDLADWTRAKFITVLQKRHVAGDRFSFEYDRLKKIRQRLADTVDAGALTGLEIDLDSDSFLSDRHRASLSRAGIETLADWASRRSQVDLPEEKMERMDAYARLYAIGINGESAKRMIEANIRSAVDLARLDGGKMRQTASAFGIKPEELERWIQRARSQAALSAATLDRTLGVVTDLPVDIGKIIEEGFIGGKCVECGEESSAFSRFAYFIYLMQRTHQTPDELKTILGLDVSLKHMSPNAADEYRPDPLADCATISLLDLVIRRLGDHLDDLRANAQTSDQRRDFDYLPYQIWRSERIAHYFPEVSALWRDDVLTGQSILESRGSILLDRQETRQILGEQLASVRAALETARLADSTGPFSDSQFDQLPEFASEPYYHEFLRGLDVIENILAADDAIQQATAELDQDQPGIALEMLQGAGTQLDAVARQIFPPDSVWYPSDGSPMQYYAGLSDMPPENRKTHIQLAYEDLMTGDKPIFKPLGSGIEVEGLREDGSIDLSHGAWDVHSAFEETVNGFAIDATSISSAPRSIVYMRGDQLEDYAVQFDFQWNGSEAAPSNFFAGILLRQAGTGGYRLSTKPQGLFIDGEYSGTEYYLVIERIDPVGAPVELARKWFGFSGRTDVENKGILRGRTYGLSFSASGSLLRGRLRINSANIIEIETVDGTYDKGLFSVAAGGGLELNFSGFVAEIEEIKGLAPFFAPNRQSGPTVKPKMSLGTDVYFRHRSLGQGMSSKLMALPLTRTTPTTKAVELIGAERSGRRLYMVFKAGQLKVDNQSLDYLLERAMAGLFFLRFAVIPTRMAQALAQGGDYDQAIRHMHLLYDDTASGSESRRQIYPQLALPQDSLGRTLSPDIRLIRLRLAELYLKMAEWFLRQDTEDTRHRARRLCERVKKLHDMNCECERQIGTVVETVVDRWQLLLPEITIDDLALNDPERLIDLFNHVFEHCHKLDDVTALLEMIDPHDPDSIDPSEFEAGLDKIDKEIEAGAERYRAQVGERINYENTMARGDKLLRTAEVHIIGAMANDPLAAARHSAGEPDVGLSRLLTDDIGTLTRGRFADVVADVTPWLWEYGEWQYPALCVPPNPLRVQQTRQACLMLDLINGCRNILGFTDTIVPPLRFEALIRIARDFADQAAAAERDLFQVRQSFEQYRLSLLEAESSLALSEGDVALETLNVDLAQGDVRLSHLQQAQTANAVAFYGDLLAAGLSDMEQLALNSAWTAAVFSGISAGFSVLAAAPALVGAAVAGAGLAQMGTGVLAGPGSITTGIGLLGTVAGGPQSLAAAGSAIASAASSTSSAASIQASYERRAQEWAHRHEQEQYSLLMAQEGLSQSIRRLDIARRRQQIAEIRRSFSADAVRFLSHKFLNTSMWVWLQRTLRDQYRTRLNYAIAAGYMAERALAFEVQNQALRVVRFDYFNPRHDGALGATQLKTDLASLESSRLRFTERKLELSRTFSLAQLFPIEFASFKSGDGRLPFSTAAGTFDADDPEAARLLELFDRDFPGHYMRLIRSVKVTVVALVPPHSGIRAKLHNSGLSRVVVGPPYQPDFKEITVRRDPEVVALSAPFQASGLFVLDYRDDLLLPFEGLGVATNWVFELPKAANAFDFRTIADVLVTIDYTALESASYRQQVIQGLDRHTSGDRPISFRHQFADAWYDLHHPELIAAPNQPMRVTFATREADFPPNTTDIKIKHVTLYIARKGDLTDEFKVELNFKAQGTGAAAGGSTTTVGGVVSTRQGSGSAWSAMIDKPPMGEWTLTFEDKPETRQLFKDDMIEEIFLVIAFSGKTREWPT